MDAYNGEGFLQPAIESILNQAFRDFELIVIDDCSIDSTPQILSEFTDERMRVIRNERNLGIAETTKKVSQLHTLQPVLPPVCRPWFHLHDGSWAAR